MNKKPLYLLTLAAMIVAVLIITGIFSSSELESQSFDNAISAYEQGKKYKDADKYDKALQSFLIALEKDPNYEDAHFAVGVIYYKKGNLAKAADSFRKVLEINPNSRETHNNLAVIYEQLGEYDQAMEELQETVRLDPQYNKGHLNLAKLYFARSIQEYFRVIRTDDKENSKIRKKLRQLLESDPENADLQYNLGLLNRMESKTDQAIKNLRSAKNLDPAYNNRVASELGALFEESGRLEEAYKEYDYLMTIDHQNVSATLAAGKIKNQLKDYAAAELILRKARTILSTPEINYELGLALEELGKKDEAIDSYKDSLKLKDNPEIHWRLGQLFKKKGEYTQALKEFETILGSHPKKEVAQKEILEITRLRLAAATPKPEPANKERVKKPTKKRDKVKKADYKVPNALVGLERETDYAILVDKSKQTLLLYQRKAGQTIHVETYACSTGKNKGAKIKNGDKKTPEGIYLFTHTKTDKELLPEYGKMAFPMDYPNLIDQKQGKDGNGIWLHSTNEPLRAYLPQKTRGCVVVSNDDIVKLSRYIKLHDTPIVVFDKITKVSIDEQEKLRNEILQLLSSWEKTWEAMDLDAYIRFYARSFTNKKMDLAAWKKYKRNVFARTNNVTLNLTPIHIIKHKNYMVLTLRQYYRADSYSDNGVKRIFLVQEDNTWRIVGEEWRKI